ncbi:LacI family DNA-binding transcriptional regulator [Methylobacterium aquaticum]|uniref:LacI family DNA-binding transcriptional regulator n=1 Tax=Methylobacterium aquaticum TaxID=270351 RepID=UPI0024781B1D|nr:LacI family DNA-binding transcriptional regulator [Methylobacterium aquaticum]
MSDVARLAGVSPMSVSNFYNQPAKVSIDTRSKILEAATALGYVPNLLTGVYTSGRSRVVGAVVPSLHNPSCASMIQGLEDFLGQNGYRLMLAIAENQASEYRAVRVFLGHRLDGIILTGTDHSHDVFQLLTRTGVPVVETWSSSGPFIKMGVGFSLFEAAFEMAQIMINRGYQQIGFVGHHSYNNLHLSKFQNGFQIAMREAGLREDLVYFTTGTLGFATAKFALDHLLQREPKLQALFCASDLLAAGAIFECARRGWSVPDRLAVASYGDYDIAAEIKPGLTTIRASGHDIGAAAARMIVESLEVGLPLIKTIDVGYEIIVRDSI